MSFFGTSARRPGADAEEIVRRYLATVADRSDPDPLFRRRLRGVVVNRYVAAREGVLLEPHRESRSAMGTLGRACLVASVALAVSVGGVMAASRSALPGELLYPIKRELEALRMRVLPSEFHDDLAIYALGQRINEVGRLAEAGNWEAVAALLPEIDAGYAMLVEMGALEPNGSASVGSGSAMLAQLLQGLPAPAQAAVERALDRAPGLNGDAGSRPQTTGVGGGRPDRASGDAPRVNRGGGVPPTPTEGSGEEPLPARSPKPKATPAPKAPIDPADNPAAEAESPDEPDEEPDVEEGDADEDGEEGDDASDAE